MAFPPSDTDASSPEDQQANENEGQGPAMEAAEGQGKQPYYIPQNYGQASKSPLQLLVYMTAGLNDLFLHSSIPLAFLPSPPFFTFWNYFPILPHLPHLTQLSDKSKLTNLSSTASKCTLKEFMALYDRAGLRFVKVHWLRSWVSVVGLVKK
jgi:hypothetical protein